MTQDSQRTAVVAIFDTRAGAEEALVALSQEGIDMNRLSIVGQDFQAEQRANESLEPEQFFMLVHGTVEMTVHARAVLGTTSSAHQDTLASKHDVRWAWV